MMPRVVTILAIAAALCASIPAACDSQDVWQPFRPLLGEWTGEGAGFGSVSEVTHEWEFVLQGQFMRLRTESVTRNPEGPDDLHEDVGYLSRDTDRAAFVFRQFLSEGFVNTFDVSLETGEQPSILFAARKSESAGGMRVQMRLVFLSETEYEMALELAAPGKELSPCQRMRMQRVM